MARALILFLCLFASLELILSYEDNDLEKIVAKQCQMIVSMEIHELKEKHNSEMNAMRAQINEIEIRNDKLITEMDDLRGKMKDRTTIYVTEIEMLRAEVKEMKTKQVELLPNVNHLSAKPADNAVDKMSHVHLESLAIPVVDAILIDSTKEKKHHTGKIIRTQQISDHGIRRGLENKVAFFAFLSSDLTHLGANQDVAFDHIVTNIGNAYNEHHGVFIAPVRGTYVFSSTIIVRNGTRGSYGHFVVNRQVVAKFFLPMGEQSSQTVILTLNPGDDVSVQNTNLDIQIMGEGGYSTFSGFLLYEDDTNIPVVG